jgi:uncharacterized coiled-coil protein SlyX
MTYKDNTPTFNINRKVVNFKDFSANPNAEKEELKKMDRQNKPNTDDQQKNMANSRYKFNNTTRKMDDLSPAEIEDKIEAIEELEEGVNNDALYAISDSFNKVKNEMNLLESRLKNARSEELQEYLNEFMNVRIGFDSLYKKFEDFDNKHFGR